MGIRSAGMHTIKEKPVVVNGEIVIRPVMVVALTYDHRLLDGREAVTFLGKHFHLFRVLVFRVLTWRVCDSESKGVPGRPTEDAPALSRTLCIYSNDNSALTCAQRLRVVRRGFQLKRPFRPFPAQPWTGLMNCHFV